MAKITLEKKEDIVKSITEEIKSDEFAAFVEYKGLTVADMAELRKNLRESGSRMTVLKLTLLKKALQAAGKDVDFSKLKSRQLALVLAREDIVSPSKALFEFAKANDKLVILSGLVEGSEVTAEQVNALAKLPSREQLLAKAFSSMQAPISNFVSVLHANLRNIVFVLKQIETNKG